MKMRTDTEPAGGRGAEPGVANWLTPPHSRRDRVAGARPHPRAWNTVLPHRDPSIKRGGGARVVFFFFFSRLLFPFSTKSTNTNRKQL